MTLIEPIPDLQWGRGDWQDYISNWRDKDIEFLQQRTVLRYQTSAARTTDWGAVPQAGQVTYNDETKALEMWHSTKGAWVRSLMFQYLTSTSDTSTSVNVSHSGAGGKGINFLPASVAIDNPLNVMGGMLQVGTDFVGIKSSGQILAKLTTDADELLSDKPLSAPGIKVTGSGVIDATGKAVTVGALTSDAISATGNITASGTVTGASVVGTTGTIGTVAIATGKVTPASGATGGVYAGQGFFYGDVDGAWVRQRPTATGTLSPTFLQVKGTEINVGDASTPATSYFNIRMATRHFGARGIEWMNAAGTARAGWMAPVVYQASDPGATNFPDGTLWLS